MRVRPVILSLLNVSANAILSNITENAITQTSPTDDTKRLDAAQVPDDFEFDILNPSHTVIGVEPLTGIDLDSHAVTDVRPLAGIDLDVKNCEDPSFTTNLRITILIAIIIAATLVTLIIGASVLSKYGLLLLFPPLFSRLKEKKVLEQFTRGRIYEHIRRNPGDYYNNIKEQLELNNGALAYHLRTLKRENLIKSMKNGIYKCFYPVGMKIPKITEKRLTAVQKDIIGTIKWNPGSTQKEISKVLKRSQQVVNYHVNLMIDSGLIRAERQNRTLRYFIIDYSV